jgi:hypothetical protein
MAMAMTNPAIALKGVVYRIGAVQRFATLALAVWSWPPLSLLCKPTLSRMGIFSMSEMS